ncbi:MAG: CmcI family methyltransferase [Terriglobia bacterium]|jgi:cephalosporin hydroxylase
MEKADSPGRRRISQFPTIVVAVLYFVVGMWLGWAWRSRSIPNLFDSFHTWFYNSRLTTWQNSYWLGVPIEKCPFDTWTYQEIIYETKPDVLVEAGTGRGGSAYYFASVFEILKRGRVLTIDIFEYPNRPQHPRITYLFGSSTSDAIFQEVKNSIHPGERVMVSLDSDHHKAHVLNELRLYSTIVTVGNYLVVEDTDINGHPILPEFGPGPMEAVEEFLKNNPDFMQDRSREKFGVTMFPGGWLKRVR